MLSIIGTAGCAGNAPSGGETETEIVASGEPPAATSATTTDRDAEPTIQTATVADNGSETATAPTKTTTTLTPMRKTAENVSTVFTITDYPGPGDDPSDEAATARFDLDRNRVVVIGTVFVDTCGRLRLLSVRSGNEALKIAIGTAEYGPSKGTATIGCEREAGTVSYEVTVAVEGDLPGRVEVVHQEGDEETFVITQ